jgi:hypothetical protein
MNVEIYSGTGDFYQYTEEQIVEFSRGIEGVFPVVTDGADGIIAMQPWSPETGEAWASEKEAIAWGNAWIKSYEDIRNVPLVDPHIVSATEKLLALGLTQEEIQAIISGK